MTESERSARRRTIVGLTLCGLLLGFLAALGWHFVAAPTSGSGEVAIAHYSQSIEQAGVAWFPSLLLCPIIGATVLLIVGLVLNAYGWSLTKDSTSRLSSPLLGLVTVGGLVGGILLAGGFAWFPPSLGVPYPIDSDSPVPTADFPAQVEIDPLWVTLPLIGALLGLAAGCLACLAGWALTRTRETPESGPTAI